MLSLFQLPEKKIKKTMDRIVGLKSSTANFTSVSIEDWCQQNVVAPDLVITTFSYKKKFQQRIETELKIVT